MITDTSPPTYTHTMVDTFKRKVGFPEHLVVGSIKNPSTVTRYGL